MKTLKSLFFLLFVFSINAFSQDVDVFNRDLNDHFVIPEISDSMNYEEFKVLSKNIRLMDAAEAIIVPGYIHFKIGENKAGYSLLATRLLGYSGLMYVNLSNKEKLSYVFNFSDLYAEKSKTNYFITVGSIALIAGTYFFDWIHGRNILEEKQRKIRYKYAIKLTSELSNQKNTTINLIPEFSFKVTF